MGSIDIHTQTVSILKKVFNGTRNNRVLEPRSTEYSEASKTPRWPFPSFLPWAMHLTNSRLVFIGNLNYRWATPLAVVQAKSIKDVQDAVNFARTHGVNLTVKNGGHSYMGYCLNVDGIVLDLSLMNDCEIDVNKDEVWMQGGCIWKQVYKKLPEENRNTIVIGGQCPYVGVSGFTLGAGISPFSRSYGLGCDNLLEMKVVTYDGELVTVSPNHPEKRNRDLFWAMTGGGGGNFGVTVEMTCRTHKLKDPNGDVVCGQLKWYLPQQEEAFRNAMNVFNTTKQPPELTIDALWTHGKKKQLIGGMTVIYNGGMNAAMNTLQPFLACAPAEINLKQRAWSDWVDESEGWDKKSDVYHHHASFIFAEGAITPELNAKISSIIKEASELVGITDENEYNNPKCHFLWDHIGAKTEERRPEDTAFWWRQGHYVSNIKLQWTDPEKSDEIMSFICKCKEILLPYAIEGKAAYINYIDSTVFDWETAYYGGNYRRLQKVKSDWDPTNGFSFWQSIKPLPRDALMPIDNVPSMPPSKEEVMAMELVKRTIRWWKEAEDFVVLFRALSSEEDVYEKDADLRRLTVRQQFFARWR
ncbi:fad linked oxidase [Fusarium albosuccineum]|uniref:Fad linked oxidase n=1 Tax=Fusarium albosuccineum TaxID=1237068 RepID=A0A8H4LGU4_9HYPO|nr:fad linked oxidase [Fusarium albosuccineum]